MDTERFFSAREAFEWITGARWKGEKRGLTNTRALLDALDLPETGMGRIIHVAGTNGKGSVCALLDKALRACGYTTGLFTSPYLCRFNERIRVNGAPISDADLIDVASRVRSAAVKLAQRGIYSTTFELLTAMACLWYRDKRVDYSIMEVGMGGRLDPTNALTSDISLIAAIGMDHMAALGDTLNDIALEKAGIIKPDVPVVALTQYEEVMRVIRARARANHAPLFETQQANVVSIRARGAEFMTELSRAGLARQTIRLSGAHQIDNACLALNALDILGVDMKRARAGLSEAIWPGRLEWIGNVLIDCAHNPQGARALADYARAFVGARRVVLLTGMMQDKQLDAVARILSPIAERVICTQVKWPRAASAITLKDIYGANAEAVLDVNEALKRACEYARVDLSERGVSDSSEGCVIVAGSVYLAGDVRNILMPDDDGSI